VVPGRAAFDYAVVTVVPRPERGERINAGVILYAPSRDWLGGRFELDEARLRALDPGADVIAIRRHLEGLRAVCAGEPDAGPVARLPARERFHWLVAPRSTVIQIARVHAGLCDDPQAALEHLFEVMVARVARE
jgi:hypothetical protein